jgi:NTE family protein
VRHAINELHKLLPPEIANTKQAKQLYELGCVTEMDIVQLIYRPSEPEGSSKDYEFSRSSMEKRWRQGMADAQAVLSASPWLAPMPKELGVRVFDMHETFSVGCEGDHGSPLTESTAANQPQSERTPRLVEA